MPMVNGTMVYTKKEPDTEVKKKSVDAPPSNLSFEEPEFLKDKDPATVSEYKKIKGKSNRTPNEEQYLLAVEGKPNTHVNTPAPIDENAVGNTLTDNAVSVANTSAAINSKKRAALSDAIVNSGLGQDEKPQEVTFNAINAPTMNSVPTVADKIQDVTSSTIQKSAPVTADVISTTSLAKELIDKKSADQNALIKALQDQMAGVGPSLAQGQLKQATDRGIAQQMAMASSMGNNPLASRQAMQNQAQIQQQAAADSAQVRMAEQLEASKQLGSMVNTAKEQDITIAKLDAELANDANKENARNKLTADVTNMTEENKINLAQASQDTLAKIETEKNRLTALNIDSSAALEQAIAKYQGEIDVSKFNAEGFIDASKFNVEKLEQWKRDRAAQMVEKYKLIGSTITNEDAQMVVDAELKAADLYKRYKKGEVQLPPEEASMLEQIVGGALPIAGGIIGGIYGGPAGAMAGSAGGGLLSNVLFPKNTTSAQGQQFGNTVGSTMQNKTVDTGGTTVGVNGQSVSPTSYKSILQSGADGADTPNFQKSDERVKNNIKPMLDKDNIAAAIKAYSYQYNNPKDGKGKQVGVMAQDVEKIKPEAVVQGPDGVKVINYNKLAPDMMASLIKQNSKIDELEEALKNKHNRLAVSPK